VNIRELDLNLLLVFNAIYTERSISKAAAKLGITQPAASNALRRLRAFTGDTLFYKSGSGVAPTRAAATLAVPISYALDTVEKGLSSVRSFDPATSQRTFRIGVNDIIHDVLVPALVSYTRREAPNLMLEFVQQDGDRAVEMLKGDEIDLALLPNFAIDSSFVSAKLWDDSFVIIVSRHHPIAKKNRLTADDIRELRFVVTTHVKRLRTFIDNAFRAEGIERVTSCAVADTQNIYPLIAVSDLAACVGRFHAERYNTDGNLVMYELPFELPQIEGRITWTKDADEDEGHRWIRERVLEILYSAFKLHNPTQP
tara:strand:+ start:134944 stop:135879 length:936 start_codon:yes stop_codon:yes gene_type:complete